MTTVMKPFSILVLLIGTSLSVVAQPGGPPPKPVRIIAQPDAPLRIVSASTRLVFDNSIEFSVVVENVSQQVIRTYLTLRGLEGDPYVGACLGPPGSIGEGLKPGEQAVTSSWQSASTFDPDLVAWVDSVNLADGTQWGPNECLRGDFIDGKRVGIRSEKERFLRIFREEGFESLMRFIKDNLQGDANGKPVLPITPPGGHSKRWNEGFIAGAREVLRDVIKVERDHGAKQVEQLLLSPT